MPNSNITFDSIGGTAPFQATGYFELDSNKYRFYFRSRGSKATIEIYDNEQDFYYLENPKYYYEKTDYTWPEAGFIKEDEAKSIINNWYERFKEEKSRGS